MATTNSLNINDDGLQDFDSTTGQFDAIALTTKGDLLGYSGSDYGRFPIGTNGFFLQADSSQTLGWRWSCAAFEFLDSQTASSSSSIEFTSFADSGCFCGYKLVWQGVETTAGSETLRLRFSVNNGSSYLTSNYQFIKESVLVDGSRQVSSNNSASALNINSHGGSSSTQWRNGELFFFNSSDPTNFLSQGAVLSHSAKSGNADFINSRTFCFHPTTSEINAFQFSNSATTLTVGDFYLYGILR